MSQLQQGVLILIDTFHKYNRRDGQLCTLNKAELKDLITNELGDVFGKSSDKEALDKIFKDLDANADGAVDFKEYVTLVACITMMCNEFFQKSH